MCSFFSGKVLTVEGKVKNYLLLGSGFVGMPFMFLTITL
jgi:hypothetical protein